jgi:putative ABC transport system ATP-binding protein
MLFLFYYTMSRKVEKEIEVKSSTTEGKTLVRIQNVVKAYETAAGKFLALKGISLEVEHGEFIGILGKSGSGKTTLINMLTGVDRVTSGEVWINGVGIHSLDENRLADWRGLNVGIIYQSFHLMPTLSLLDNILLPMDFCGLYKGRESIDRAHQLLEMVGLGEHALKNPSAISGGQQQRAAIARALANDPLLIVADEPTGRLDSANAENIFTTFMMLVEQGKTILMATHDHGLIDRMSRTVEISDGEFVNGWKGKLSG